MKLVDKHILRELVGPFLFGVAAFSSVFFAGAHLQKLTGWVMKGMPIITAIKILILLLPSIIVYTLPMATLLAVLLGVGRLSGDSEIVALFASGVSIYRLAVPVIALGIIVTGCSIFLNEVVAPQTNLMEQELVAAVKKLEIEAIADRPFSVTDSGTNSQISVKGGMDVDTGTLRNITIVQFNAKEPAILIYAEQAQWAGMNDSTKRSRWRLYDGNWQILGGQATASSTFKGLQTKEIILQKTPEQLSLYQKDTEQMSFSELSRVVNYHKNQRDKTPEEIREMDVDRWNKLSLPISSLVFAMLAVPMGIRPHRSSSSVGLGMSIFLIFLYWMVWRYTSALAVQGNVSAIFGAFIADILGVSAALILLKRAAK